MLGWTFCTLSIPHLCSWHISLMVLRIYSLSFSFFCLFGFGCFSIKYSWSGPCLLLLLYPWPFCPSLCSNHTGFWAVHWICYYLSSSDTLRCTVPSSWNISTCSRYTFTYLAHSSFKSQYKHHSLEEPSLFPKPRLGASLVSFHSIQYLSYHSVQPISLSIIWSIYVFS